MTNPIIEIQNLTIGYGAVTILENLSFKILPGEIFIILGGSGCGKSTLMNHMIGLYEPQNGSIFIHGKNLVTADRRERENILESFGVSFQGGALLGSMTLLDNVMLPLAEHTHLPEKAVRWIARQKLQLVGLEGYDLHMPSELSGGMQKRAALARAIALDPDILFLDEPSAGLDPVTAAHLDELILQLSRLLGVTFVIVTHELQSIFSLAGRAIMLDRDSKGIIADGNPNDMKNDRSNPAVWRFFNRTTLTEPV
jgi:phospholipid/cholesterol/gamma-HCH transport system ATP-binding protein